MNIPQVYFKSLLDSTLAVRMPYTSHSQFTVCPIQPVTLKRSRMKDWAQRELLKIATNVQSDTWWHCSYVTSLVPPTWHLLKDKDISLRLHNIAFVGNGNKVQFIFLDANFPILHSKQESRCTLWTWHCHTLGPLAWEEDVDTTLHLSDWLVLEM
jgi:hypothetical protein